MNALVEQGAARAIRNALVRAKQAGGKPIQGACGVFKACGAGLGIQRGLFNSGKVCPLCAISVVNSIPTSEPDLTGKAAEALGVSEDWILSFFQGYDGEELLNGEKVAYRMGRKLWGKFKPAE